MHKFGLVCGLAIALAGAVSWMGMYQGSIAAPTTGLMAVADLETVHYYDVKGRTLDELRGDVFSRGPYDQFKGQRFAGWTSWQIKWWLDHRASQDSCRVVSARTETHVTYTMPRWSDERQAATDLQQAWRRFVDALIDHEKGHGRIARQLGERIKIAIQALPPRATCRDLEQQANTLAQAMIRDDKEQEAYDRRTSHGEKQGASFPRLLVRAPMTAER